VTGRSWVGMVCLALAYPSIVGAHAALLKSIPAPRAVLFKAPANVQLWFSEKIEPRFSSLKVADSDGNQVDLGDARVAADDPKQLAVGIKPLRPGIYTVEFRVHSIDGHVIKDRFRFTIGQRRREP